MTAPGPHSLKVVVIDVEPRSAAPEAMHALGAESLSSTLPAPGPSPW